MVRTDSKSNGTRLDSWKEIAAYLRRDIRTVQRWEKLEALPVHRHQHLKRGSPFAYASELDAWWEGRGRELETVEIVPAATPVEPEPVRIAPASSTQAPLRWLFAGLLLALVAGIAVHVGGRSEPTVTPLRRLSVMLPAETELRVPYRPTVSPDGRLLALVGYDQKGISRIWVRALDSLTPTLLAGTEGAEWPFWSPDSKHLGFFAAGKLKVVPLGSGEARILCDAPNGRGGTWADDTILFAPYLSDGLYSVPASGGVPRRVTTVAREQEETAHRWPQFLPDGKHFIFFVIGGQKARGTHVASLDNGAHAVVLRGTSVAVHSAGYLLFWSEGRLGAQAFDRNTGKVYGQILFLPDKLRYNQGYGISYASASQNGVLVYAPSGPAQSGQLTWFDRSGNMLDKVGPVTTGQAWVALAPNGEQAAVHRFDEETQNLSIWLGDLRRRAWSRFTFGDSGEMWPVWSPDGRRMAFGSTRSSGLAAIYEMPVDSNSSEKLLLQESTVLTPTDWSRDGQFLLFQSVGARQNRHIKVASLSDPKRIIAFPESGDTQFDAISARFSPDGHWIAYASNESGTFEVYVRQFPFTAGSKQSVSTDGGYNPRWRPDGKELLYVAPDRRLMSVAVISSNPLRLGSPEPLFELPIQTPGRAFSESTFDVSPDGKRFLVGRTIRSEAQALTIVLDWTSGLPH
jgi:Tol biopolymer transport system component